MLPKQTTFSPCTRTDASSLDEKQTYGSPSSTLAPSDRDSVSSIKTESTSTFVANGITHNEHLSTAQLLAIHIGAALTLFLATTDATIVSTSLPTISSDLKASPMQYTWVGVAYMLTQTAFQPLYGRVSDLMGRKNVLYSSMAVFAIGSALCGAAKSINWLIAARALAGIGGGGIVSAVWVITAEVVEIRQRAKWSQALSITWSCSAVAGPLIGGLFSGKNASLISWRWGFYINLPVSLFALVVLVASLRNVPFKGPPTASWQTFCKRFDFIGLLMFMTGTSFVIIGFSLATQVGWTNPLIPSLITVGAAVLVCGGFYEKHTTRDRLFPHTVFANTTTIIILLISFFHNVAFTAGTFYLALFFQAAHGSSPLRSGLELLPYSLGSSLSSMPVAWFIGYWQRRTHDTSGQNWMISIGLLISTLGFGLLNLLDEEADVVSQILYPLIAGIGIGMLFHAPYQVFTRALKPHEIATGTSAFFLVRFTGATIGLAIAGTIFYARTSARLPPDLKFQNSPSSINYDAIKYLPPIQKEAVLHTISSAIRLIWTISFLLQKMPSSDNEEPMKLHTASTTESPADKEIETA
ncbi:major facilitator superfamily domain-containing protein [Gymnopilus junonius]|uniref:Major facilitator superfamily domain-containing protein n=1 Tax=Gymnopilus junonius TaxID=109634 RepID=A0A9P5NJ26_GYMJU|nr:major facilitator superfamily domain-containing protein [Gymnopilus junonius]